jgi:CubicO group peptidase (beta-lactamase class C family)
MSKGAFSKQRLIQMRDRMKGFVERGEVPGIVTLISRRGGVEVETYGVRTLEGREPISRDTIFRIASMTKPIAAVAAMILTEECKVRLDEPVDRLLPELANRRVLKRIDAPLDDTVPANRPITLRDLLTFRLGIGIVMAPPGTYPIQRALAEQRVAAVPPTPQGPPAPDEWIRRLGLLPLMAQPGERWLYGIGANVLGVLIARASGQPLETFMRERIFEPLGMKDTAFHCPPDKLDRFSACYQTDLAAGGLRTNDPADESSQWGRPPAFPAAAGGLVSTIDDFFAFANMMRTRGGSGRRRIISRASFEVMTTNQLTAEQRSTAGMILPSNGGWGFGLSVALERDNLWGGPGTYGWFGGAGSSWANDPVEDVIGILLTTRMFDSPAGPVVLHDFWTSTYQAIKD